MEHPQATRRERGNSRCAPNVVEQRNSSMMMAHASCGQLLLSAAIARCSSESSSRCWRATSNPVRRGGEPAEHTVACEARF